MTLKNAGPLSQLAIKLNLENWEGLTQFVRELPYGRNANRHDLGLVLTEQKGTCSSKHALLKAIADENNFDVKLLLGIYKMNHINTPGIGNHLIDNHLEFIPEAHCYLEIAGKKFDYTTTNSSIERIQNYILEELEIQPNQVSEFKVELHKKYIKKWAVSKQLTISFEELWEIREHCIKNLSI